jgi:hypothetical protein
MFIYFDGIQRPIQLENCPELLDMINNLSKGWKIECSEILKDSNSPIIYLKKSLDQYVRHSGFLKESVSFSDPLDAACDFFVDLIKAFVHEPRNKFLCLHASAVCKNGNLLLFPNTYRAGKSLLASCLASRGCNIFADDVVPIIPQTLECLAPGIAARLRTPFPNILEERTSKFINEQTLIRNGKYSYLNPNSARLVSHGEKGLVTEIIFLERNQNIDGIFEYKLKNEIVLKNLLQRNFSYVLGAKNSFDILKAISNSIPAKILSYKNTESLSDYIYKKYFLKSTTKKHDMIYQKQYVCKFQKNKKFLNKIIEETQGDFLFLLNQENNKIFCADGIAKQIWHLISSNYNKDSCINIISSAFPQKNYETIKKDVNNTFFNLEKNGFLKNKILKVHKSSN